MAKAATLLATSQPAVSRAIADIEATLGVSLLERSSQGVQPTPYGDALIKRGVAVFDELRQGIKDIDFIADPTAGEVKIGGTSATMTGIISTVISRMSLKYSRVNFQVVTRPPSTLLHELRERNLDMVISMTFDPVTDENIQSEILYEDYHSVSSLALLMHKGMAAWMKGVEEEPVRAATPPAIALPMTPHFNLVMVIPPNLPVQFLCR